MEIEALQIPKRDIFSFVRSFVISPPKSQSRSHCTSYKNLGSKFSTPEQKNFNTQYCHLYYVRLMSMKPFMVSTLLSMNYNPLSILKLPKDEMCCVIGVIYREMKLKPNILHRLEGSYDKVGQISSYASPDDVLYIEDENGKVRLDFSDSNESLNSLCSGLVAAISGIYDGKVLKVKEMFFPGANLVDQASVCPNLQNYLSGNRKEDDNFIAFVSGLNIDGSLEKTDYHLSWLKQLIFGNLSTGKINSLFSRISRTVIAGNSIKKETFNDNSSFMGAAKVQELLQNANKEIRNSLSVLDKFIQELSKSVPVDLLGGDHDPNTSFFPFQPLNKLFFEKSYQNKHFSAVTNPYSFEMEGKRVFGTSGINIHGLRKSGFEGKTDLELMELTLKWGHIAPTTPETIGCYPYTDQDPLIMDDIPDVYFMGNSNEFSTKIMVEEKTGRKIRIIAIPNFAKTRGFVMLNMKNLDCFEIRLENAMIP